MLVLSDFLPAEMRYCRHLDFSELALVEKFFLRFFLSLHFISVRFDLSFEAQISDENVLPALPL